MSAQQITLSLPDALYEQLKTAADRSRRSLDEVLVEVLTALAPVLVLLRHFFKNAPNSRSRSRSREP